MAHVAEKRARFRRMHAAGCFVLPNPWDIGSLRRLEALGFEAVASTSAGLAWSLGKRDYELRCAEVLTHLASLCAATSLPVNADFEGGFADAPADVAANVRLVVAAGVAGLSIEDRLSGGLYPADVAVARVAAAKAAAGPEVVLVARCEAYLVGQNALAPVIARLAAFAAAGADCVYAPGVSDMAEIAALVRAVAPVPVNVLLRRGMSVGDLAVIGVRRVSVGGALAAAAWSGFDAAARVLRDEGRLAAG